MHGNNLSRKHEGQQVFRGIVMNTPHFYNAAMSPTKLSQWLEMYQFSEYHEINIEKEADHVFKVIKNVDISQSRIIRTLFKIRGLPQGMSNFYAFLENGFILLEEKENDEIILGFLIGWNGLAKVPPDEFKHLQDKRYIKGVWNFKLAPLGKNTVLSTETRVYCPTMLSRIRFSIYWFVISRFSGLIRIIMLRSIKEQVELSP